ncbi:hypothetical protein [Actinophytocola sp.]|uniref:hypothetical protein n=1 Tax=Actinophytocola sp. TaxID=1872138 RepID=UPI002D7FBAA0|nr:hypothetical protein [Actinophytocola sp.]HET9140820.1 hypothetical protein [Actinophytocola sp.]
MDGSGLFVDTAQLVTAADGFLAAANETKNHAETMDAELKPYANSPEMFQGPLADEFRRLYREIWDDLLAVKTEATAMSQLVEQAKTEFSKRSVSAAGQLPTHSGGGSVLQGLSGQ